MKKMILLIAAAVLLILSCYFCLNCGSGCEPVAAGNSENTHLNRSTENCGEKNCSSNCSVDKNGLIAEQEVMCNACGQNSCTETCHSNPENDSIGIKSLLPSCSLSNAELVDRKEKLRSSIVTKIDHVEELPTGYDLVFTQPAEYSTELLAFINFERGCCSSFTYAMIFEPDNQAIHLQIYGSAEIKKELRTGFAEFFR